MRRFRKSPERAPSMLERMGGKEERTSEIGRARAEAERRETEGPGGFWDTEERRRGRSSGHHVRATRRPRHAR